MPEPALIDATCEANGHPTECTEPAPGTVVSDSTTGITVTVDGTSKELASIDSASIDIPSHAHSYNTTDGCHNTASHTLDPDTGIPSITIDGSPIYAVEDNVTTDPISGGSVDITSNPITTDITQQ
jgi:hypothetical protein